MFRIPFFCFKRLLLHSSSYWCCGWVLLTTNAIFGSGSPTRLFWSLPAIFGVAALLLVVTYLNRFLSQ